MADKSIVVVGSYNVGLFLKGQQLPNPGQSVIGDEFYEGGGGKGSNQAVAASILGADTTFIGRIGADKYGQDALAMYKAMGVKTNCIAVDKTIHSGISVILIDKNGNNLISIVPGANYNLCKEDICKAEKVIKRAAIVGFQLENKVDIVARTIKKVHATGIKTLLDPAPAVKLPDALYPFIDYIKPNETEAEILTGIKVHDAKSAVKAAAWFIKKGAQNAIVTLGAGGAVFLAKGGAARVFPAIKVTAVDTTGAGDIFSGGLMAALAKGQRIEDAIEFANHAAALSVTKRGVISAIPTLDEVVKFMAMTRKHRQ